MSIYSCGGGVDEPEEFKQLRAGILFLAEFSNASFHEFGSVSSGDGGQLNLLKSVCRAL